ncbi:hypothetical protein O5O45_19450 [Hahella aquimaris]|uniref:hypothetical protein n=1 Tax=Hahella sp. HNIBRBA332 TaxID=3015983 RepID=UPI00273C1BE7|nr:hypothetical protein [Hahella sp. HNIBRBA332]WLQ11907.1 hypothetical protein O5O45_19450 [Hahella sp. HNIBRBA332]
MSMSLLMVLALGVEPNTNELNQFAKENEYNIEYAQNTSLNERSGFLPAKLNGQEAGVEVYSFPVSKLSEPFKTVEPLKFSEGTVYQLRFGVNPIEAQSAFTAAVILTTKYNGVAIDDQSGSLMSAEQLTQALSYFAGM